MPNTRKVPIPAPSYKVPKRALKAYENPAFLKSRDARVIRMLCEYLEPLQRFQRLQVRESIVFFGSSRARPAASVQAQLQAAQEELRQAKDRPPAGLQKKIEDLGMAAKLARYYEDAAELSKMLTTWSQGLGNGGRFMICSGGGPGIMEAANRGATELAGGRSIGLAISLPTEEQPNPFITPELLFEFHYFFMRKLWFVYMATALVVFPGGFGTMDELFEVLTLVQTRKIERPLPIVLYGKKFWQDFFNMEQLVRWGTISPEDLKLYKVCDSPKEAYNWLTQVLLQAYPKPLSWGTTDVRRLQDRNLP